MEKEYKQRKKGEETERGNKVNELNHYSPRLVLTLKAAFGAVPL